MGNGQMQEYRWLHLHAIQKRRVVPQDTVDQVICFPEGVELGRLTCRHHCNKCPDALRRIDPYDQLNHRAPSSTVVLMVLVAVLRGWSTAERTLTPALSNVLLGAATELSRVLSHCLHLI